jgi:oligoribonuclease NrnB/cAMP/cGMP phosphodiesterase (DHH superfamily)
MNKKLVLTHANCVDGCCSRAILEEQYGTEAVYIAVDHIDYDPKFADKYELFMNQVKDVKNTHVIMSDICLPASYIDMFLENQNKVTILDHHKTAMPIIESFEKRINEGEQLALELHCSKDNDKSGAMLTWEYIKGNTPAPDLVVYISEGDRWDFQHEETKYFYSGLLDGKEPNSYTSEDWLKILKDKTFVEEFVKVGKPIYDTFMATVESYANTAVPVVLNGKSGLMAFAPSAYRNEIGNILALRSNGFGLIVEEKVGKISCSLRSVAPFDIDDIAKKFGGGGHAQASAFKLISMELLQELLNNEGNTIDVLSPKKMKMK